MNSETTISSPADPSGKSGCSHSVWWCQQWHIRPRNLQLLHSHHPNHHSKGTAGVLAGGPAGGSILPNTKGCRFDSSQDTPRLQVWEATNWCFSFSMSSSLSKNQYYISSGENFFLSYFFPKKKWAVVRINGPFSHWELLGSWSNSSLRNKRFPWNFVCLLLSSVVRWWFIWALMKMWDACDKESWSMNTS